ncbi:MAG: hypothetical protein ACYTF1_13520 [Planctomycetota bacterium]|jgi:hypothetical protein
MLYIISVGLIGCGPKPTISPESLPLDDAPIKTVIARVNQNNTKMNFLMKAFGDTETKFTDNKGKSHTFHLRNTLIYGKPRNLYLILEHIGDEVMEVGSNDKLCWIWRKQGNQQYAEGLHAKMKQAHEIDIPVRPDYLLDVLGLGDLPTDTTGPKGPLFWVGSKRYELAFVDRDKTGQMYYTKTVCIENKEPFLVREIVFFHPNGRPIMLAELSEYKTITGSNILAPHHIKLKNLQNNDWLELKFDKMRRLDRTEAQKKMIFRSPVQSGKYHGPIERLDEPSKLGSPKFPLPTTQPKKR